MRYSPKKKITRDRVLEFRITRPAPEGKRIGTSKLLYSIKLELSSREANRIRKAMKLVVEHFTNQRKLYE
jgi:hypothetical protein